MTSPLAAIVWKEVRESLKWAVFGCFLISAALIFWLQQVVASATRGENASPDIFYATAFLFPLIGLGIGLAQTLPESRGDKWAFLAHRPVSRSTMFWGKAIAGTALVLSAASLPLIGAVAWIARPGNLPVPFDARMALPGVADLLCGLVFYFAGLMTGMRDARWSSSRTLGIGAAIVCTVVSLNSQNFWNAAAFDSAVLIVIATAAWETFNSGGRYESQSRIGRFTTGIVVTLGIVVSGLAMITIIETVTAKPINVADTGYDLAPDGTIVKETTDGFSVFDVRDLQGNPVANDNTHSDSVQRVGMVLSNRASYPDRGYRGTHDLYLRVMSGEQPQPDSISWYYIPRLDLLCGYENRTARFVGWIGPDGFTPSLAPPDQRFHGPLLTPRMYARTLVAFPDSVYFLDTNQKQIERVFTPAAGEMVIGAAGVGAGNLVSKYGERAQFHAIATTKRVVIQSLNGTVEYSVPHDPEAAGYGELSVIRALQAPGGPTFLWYNPFGGRPFTSPQLVTKLGTDGTVAAHYTLPNTDRPFRLPWTGRIFDAVLPVTAHAAQLLTSRWTHPDTFADTLRNQRAIKWILSIITSLICAAATFARGRKFAFGNRRLWLWTFLGFVLGPVGIALMLSLLEWPVFETCPACGQRRLVTHELCEHCSKPFALPQRDGTEIFEPLIQS